MVVHGLDERGLVMMVRWYRDMVVVKMLWRTTMVHWWDRNGSIVSLPRLFVPTLVASFPRLRTRLDLLLVVVLIVAMVMRIVMCELVDLGYWSLSIAVFSRLCKDNVLRMYRFVVHTSSASDQIPLLSVGIVLLSWFDEVKSFVARLALVTWTTLTDFYSAEKRHDSDW